MRNRDHAFKEQYKKLNAEQKKAVDTVEGPVMVIAGPGTGKTTILTLRIAQILRKTDTDPSAILALTFTESAVQSMREKLKRIIGGDAYKVRIHTFHGFCNEIISRHPESFPRIIGSTTATEVDKVRIVERIIEDGEFEHIKPYGDPYYFVTKILSFIQDVKRDDMSPDELEELLGRDRERFEAIPGKVHTRGRYEGKMKGEFITQQKHLDRMDEVARTYRLYEEALRTERLFDFEDMLLEVVRQLRQDESFKLELQEQFHYILADEHQDANYAQNAILEHLSDFHDEPNLFIVGDEKQAIFRFQGASLENFLYFTKRFPEAVVVQLTTNYRSTQTILDSAHELITSDTATSPHDMGDLRVPLSAGARDAGREISIRAFSHSDLEHAGIAHDIVERIKGGVAAHEIAVIYRNNAHAGPIALALDALSVPYIIESRQNILADTDIQKLLLFLRALNDTSNDELVGKMLFLDFLKLPLTDVSQVLLHHRKTDIAIIKILTTASHLEKAGVDNTDAMQHAGKQFVQWAGEAKNRGTLEVFETLVRNSGFLENVLQLSDSAEKLHVLGELFDEARRAGERYQLFTLAAFLEHLSFIETYNIPITASSVYTPPDAVRLMTAHRSKGLEFEHVYIIGALDGTWGNRRNISAFRVPRKTGDNAAPDTSLDDERRLFYVAITRAQESVTVSYAEQDADGRVQSRTQFIDEIPETYQTEIDMRAHEQDLVARVQKERFTREGKQGISLSEEEFLRSRFLEQGLSVTALNNYLACPWQYFFRNLVRLPEAPTMSLRYGTAVHDALRHMLDAYREKEMLDPTLLMDRFKQSVARLTYSDAEYARLIQKGEASLPGFFEHYKNKFSKNAFTEYDISDVFVSITSDIRILLRGKLDMVVPYEDHTMHVVDFKTGKPKSKNAIEGKTKTESGDYKRQLVFYKLLYDTHSKGRTTMATGEIVFTEPNTSGKYKEELFEISDTEVTTLADVISDVGKEIYELGFWNETCSDKACRYCALRRAMA